MARFTENRWTSAIIPALLIHIPIGTVYCWSVFKQLIADRLNASPASVEWGFSLAIFFLGMSAAFAGPMVEKNIKKSALVSMVCFVVGFAGTGVSIALGFLPGVFICYGAIMGIGLGVGYLTPVKNLMLWFSDNKGLATGIAVAGFGLAKAIASPLMEYLIGTVGLVNMFFILAVIYAVMMFFGFLLIKRPADWVYDPVTSHVSRAGILRKPVFWGIWIASTSISPAAWRLSARRRTSCTMCSRPSRSMPLEPRPSSPPPSPASSAWCSPWTPCSTRPAAWASPRSPTT